MSQQPQPVSKLMNAEAASSLLGGISTAMLRKLANNGKLTRINIGRCVFYPTEEIQRLAREGTKGACRAKVIRLNEIKKEQEQQEKHDG